MSTKEKKTKVELSAYQKQIHTFGRVTNIIAVAALIAVPLMLSLISGIPIDLGLTVKGFIGIGSLMGVMVIVEFMSYAPILGAGATYLTFITGNTMNMKLPAAKSSVRLAGVEETSPEAEIISTMAVAVSSLVTIIILLVGLFGLNFLLPVLQNPVLKPGFDNLMPALMGAMGLPVLVKSLKEASVPVIIAIILTLIMGYAAFSRIVSMALPAFMAIAVAWSYVIYRRDLKKKEQS
ncbi:MAG TPA: hypothetical protein DCO79_14835 [Spirochaeta sp.]|nr:hypothetical protein [Spirochaeta sp.]